MYSLDSSEIVLTTFSPQDHDAMAGIWIELMTRAGDIESLSRCKLGYCDLLIARQDYAEARLILEELNEAQGQAQILSRLAHIDFATGHSAEAKVWLLQEQACLPEKDVMARAVNAFSLARLALKEAAFTEAVDLLRLAIDLALHAGIAKAGTLEGKARHLLGNLAYEQNETELARYYYVSAQKAFARAGNAAHHQRISQKLDRMASGPAELSWNSLKNGN